MTAKDCLEDELKFLEYMLNIFEKLKNVGLHGMVSGRIEIIKTKLQTISNG